MLGVPVPTPAELIMEHKRLSMIGDLARIQRHEASFSLATKKRKGVLRVKPQIPPTLVLKSASTDDYTPIDIETSLPSSPYNHHDQASSWRVQGREPSLRQVGLFFAYSRPLYLVCWVSFDAGADPPSSWHEKGKQCSLRQVVVLGLFFVYVRSVFSICQVSFL